MDGINLEKQLREKYDPIFVENFISYLVKNADELGDEIIPFTQSAYNVVLCADHMVTRRRAAEEGSDLYKVLRRQELEDKISIDFKDLFPHTKFDDLGFDRFDMGALKDLLNDKLEVYKGNVEGHKIYTQEIRDTKTIDQCTRLFYDKYKRTVELICGHKN